MHDFVEMSAPRLELTAARQALEAAGALLDRNQAHEPRWHDARVLLDQALRAAAEALGFPGREGNALEIFPADVGALAAGSVAERERAVRALESATAGARELELIERVTVELVRRAEGRRRLLRPAWLVRGGNALLCAGAAALMIAMALPYLQRREHWSASSAYAGYLDHGVTGETRDHGLILATKSEQNPWVIVELGAPRVVRGVRVSNRTTCCQDAILPLDIEIRDANGEWKQVAHRADAFVRWEARFPPQTTRQVRLIVHRDTSIAIADVEIL